LLAELFFLSSCLTRDACEIFQIGGVIFTRHHAPLVVLHALLAVQLCVRASDFQQTGVYFSVQCSWNFGGREWESNPPKTVSRPLPYLKSGRPTRDDSLPIGSAASTLAASAGR